LEKGPALLGKYDESIEDDWVRIAKEKIISKIQAYEDLE